IAALDFGTGLATGWNPDADGEVLALITQGGSIFAGGNFMTIGGALRDSLAELDSTGTATGWDPGTDGSVFALESDGTNLFVGGSFTTLAGAGRNNTGAVNLISGTTTGFNPNAVSAVNALAASGGQVFVGGAFVGLGAPASRNRLAAIDLSTGSVLPWNPGANDVVNALATDGTNIYAGGFFTNIAGVSRNRIASLGSSTGTATGWNPDANAFVNALAVNGGVVYAGGGFTTIGGAARSYLAALDASGSATAWNPGANATVNALALDGQTLYVGGGFILVDGQLRLYAAALDTAALSSPYVTGWTADADATVLAIAHDTNNVYLGGNFANLAGSARSFVGSVAKSGGLTSFNPGPDAPVLALGNEQTNLYTGGDFGSLGGGARSGVALLDTSAGLAGWNLQLDRYNQTAYDVLPGSADFIAGGTLGQAASFGYVAYFTKPTVQFDTSASAGLETVTPSSIEVTLSAPDTQDTLVTYSVTGGSATNGADYTLATGVVTIPAGSTSAIISLPIIDDTLIEGDETVVLTLSGPSVNAVLGAPSQHTYTIQENDLGPGAGGPNTNTVTRIPGDTPLEQAIEFSQRRFSTSGSAQAAIITRDDIVVDAFASSPLSNRLDATLLLTNSGGLDSSVLAELNRAISGAQSPIYLSGGLAALSAQVEQDLRNAGYTNINRFAGANRRETARLIADEIMVQNTSPTDTAFVTEDQAFVDSLVIGAVAGRDTDSIVEPVLLNPRGDSAVDQHLAGFLSVHPEITKLQIIGGTSAVAAGLESALQATGRTVTRTAGADRYETNIAVVNANFTAPARVVVARGDKGGIAGAKMVQASQAVSEQFFAALLASAFAADFEMPLLLVTPDSVPGPISQYLSGNALAINDVFIVGSTGEISSGVEATIGSLI
ncbi:MAG: cell wall-binding repeat-containing protein, partial [bacterium]|nr:cell wall-binding repeat-containing protein [bacterium]